MSQTQVNRDALETALTGFQRYSEVTRGAIPRDTQHILTAQAGIAQAVRVLEANVRALEDALHRARAELARTEAALQQCQSQSYRDSDGHWHSVDCSGPAAAVHRASQKVTETQRQLQQMQELLGQAMQLERRMQEVAESFYRQAARLKKGVDHEGSAAIEFLKGRLGALGDYEGGTQSLVAIEAFTGASVSFDREGLAADVGSEGGAYLAHYHKEDSDGRSVDDAYIGAETSLKGGIHVSATEAVAALTAETFIGTKIGATRQLYSGKIAGVDAKVTGGVSLSYGVGATLDVHGGWSDGHARLKADIGATFGLGGGIKFDLDLNTGQAALAAVNLGKGILAGLR